jgi:hypothetical protein
LVISVQPLDSDLTAEQLTFGYSLKPHTTRVGADGPGKDGSHAPRHIQTFYYSRIYDSNNYRNPLVGVGSGDVDKLNIARISPIPDHDLVLNKNP